MSELLEIETEKAFHTLLSLNQPKTNFIEDQLIEKYPFCLQKKVADQLAILHCQICTNAQFSQPQDLVSHGSDYHHSSQDDIQCCFCGEIFSSSLTLSMHNLVIPFTAKCDVCSEDWDCLHVCDSKVLDKVHTKENAYSCPLGCDPRMRFHSKEIILSHLNVLHGCEVETEAVFHGFTVSVDTNKGSSSWSRCPECGVLIKILVKSMIYHIVFHCNARGKIQKEYIKHLLHFAETNGLDPELVTRLEFEAHSEDYRNFENKENEKNLSVLYRLWSKSLDEALAGQPRSVVRKILDLYSDLLVRKFLMNEEDLKWPSSRKRKNRTLENLPDASSIVKKIEAELMEMPEEVSTSSPLPQPSASLLQKLQRELKEL